MRYLLDFPVINNRIVLSQTHYYVKLSVNTFNPLHKELAKSKMLQKLKGKSLEICAEDSQKSVLPLLSLHYTSHFVIKKIFFIKIWKKYILSCNAWNWKYLPCNRLYYHYYQMSCLQVLAAILLHRCPSMIFFKRGVGDFFLSCHYIRLCIVFFLGKSLGHFLFISPVSNDIFKSLPSPMNVNCQNKFWKTNHLLSLHFI